MATFNFNRNNLIAGTTYSTLTSSGTSLLVSFDTDTASGNATASSFSDTLPDVPFFATLSPSGVIPNLLNSEIVLVTAKTWVSASSTWQFTITRAQRGTTARAFGTGSVFLGGVYTEDIDYSQAVGKGFFTASYSMGVFYISDAMLPTAPTDGMSIKVVFSQDVTSGTLGLSLNDGTVYNVYSGASITSAAGTTTSTPLVKAGIIYELVFYNGAWYAMNVPAASSIMSDNIDWTTMIDDFVLASDTLTISRAFPFRLLVIGSSSTWGYGGGQFTTAILCSPTPTSISSVTGYGTNGDTIARSTICAAKLVCAADTSYSITVSRSSSGGRTGSDVLAGVISRLS